MIKTYNLGEVSKADVVWQKDELSGVILSFNLLNEMGRSKQQEEYGYSIVYNFMKLDIVKDTAIYTGQ
ncbi:hypothetical protein HRbin01_01282 [archaeon HR01]|nr:hypothetical protein HRbin01_01282 [archaeon HR01]